MFSKFFRFSANAAINTAHISIKSLILVSIFLKGSVISIARVAEEKRIEREKMGGKGKPVFSGRGPNAK